MQVDVIDLCALLECTGLKIKCVDSVDLGIQAQSRTGNTVTVVCNKSGLRVVLESESTACSCPVNQDEHSSGFWQVSGVSHGVVENNKESGSSMIGSLPGETKKIITRELHKLIQYSRGHTTQDNSTAFAPKLKRCALFSEMTINRTCSLSLTDLNVTPPEDRLQHLQLKVDTPTRYRSLDTLTNLKNVDEELPAPGQLVAKAPAFFDTSDVVSEDMLDTAKFKRKTTFKRQQTYTKSTPDKSNVMMKSKTSSPIGRFSESILQNLLNVEKTAETLRDKIAILVKKVMVEDEKPEDISVASLVLDVSKISIAKDPSSKKKFISSPNLSAHTSKRQDNISTSTLIHRRESNSTSQLAVRQTPTSIKPSSKLKRLSPSFFRKKKDDEKSPVKQNTNGTYKKLNDKLEEKKEDKLQNKLTGQLKPRMTICGSGIRTPTNKPSSEMGTSMSTTKKKMYSHVKSTIPKPTYTSKKE